MFNYNKVIWGEGTFLQPQHFQQQNRYFENLLTQRIFDVQHFSWGIKKIEVDYKLLALGKLVLLSCSGVFSDGTQFNAPMQDALPEPIELPNGINDQEIHIGVSIERPSNPATEIVIDENNANGRYILTEQTVFDTSSKTPSDTKLEVGQLALKFLFSEKNDIYCSLPILKIRETRADKNIILDDKFLPPLLNIKENNILSGYIDEVIGLLRLRADALAERLCNVKQQGTGEIIDFMLLQLINKTEPIFINFKFLPQLHPLTLYYHLITLLSEINTFTSPSRRPGTIPQFNHYSPGRIFNDLCIVLEKLYIR